MAPFVLFEISPTSCKLPQSPEHPVGALRQRSLYVIIFLTIKFHFFDDFTEDAQEGFLSNDRPDQTRV